MNGMSLHPNPKGAPTGCQISITRHSAAKDFRSLWTESGILISGFRNREDFEFGSYDIVHESNEMSF